MKPLYFEYVEAGCTSRCSVLSHCLIPESCDDATVVEEVERDEQVRV